MSTPASRAYPILSALTTLLALLGVTVSNAPAQQVVGAVYAFEGGAALIRDGGGPVTVAIGTELRGGDTVTVDTPGRLAIKLTDGSYVRLAQGVRASFPREEKRIDLVSGLLHFFSHSEQHPTITTPEVTAAIRGTELTVEASSGRTYIALVSGAALGTSPSGSAELRSGDAATFTRGAPPVLSKLVQGENAAQWAVFVPLLDSRQDFSAAPAGAATDEVSKLLALLSDTAKPVDLASLRPRAGDECSERGIIYNRTLLARGAIDEAKTNLTVCMNNAGVSAQSIALSAATLSLLALVSADSVEADTLSKRAVSVDPSLPSVRLARSFALQASSDLDGALAALGEEEQDDATVRARRAEIQFAQGHVSKARHLLEGIAQRNWYAESIYGFVLLGDRERELAEAAFGRANEAAPAAGLPRVGLGLVRMSQGRIEDAQREFEQAVHLEPLRAQYRSYLAKAYFEGERSGVSLPEFEQAIKLDPLDPTPHLYRSFALLARNEPVAALADVETALQQTNARGTYRSSLLLDQDSGIQSASLSRVFRDLGFGERGRIEAIRAITFDYRNPSAHRLLAESQDTTFLADASLSERRISDLFAPLSINVADSIATDVSLNEYSALFERDGTRTGISTIYDTEDDDFTTGVLSLSKSDNIVAGLTATGNFGDGIDSSPRRKLGRIGFTLQGQPSWESRYSVEARGNLERASESDATTDFASGSVAGAYLHRFSPKTTMLVQSRYERRRDWEDTFVEPTRIISSQILNGEFDPLQIDALVARDTDRYATAVTNEAQLISVNGSVTSILTARSAVTDIDAFDTSTVLEDELGELTGRDIPLRSSGPTDIASSSVSYLSDVALDRTLHINAGGEFASTQWASREIPPFARETESSSRWTPKGGLVFSPSQRLMVRAGYTESLGKGVFEDLTSIAPTLVGGINQRFKDLPGSRAKTFGTGIDGKPLESTYVGAEWIRRWIQEPSTAGRYNFTVDFDNDTTFDSVFLDARENTSIRQHFVRGYLYHVLTESLVIGSEYRFSQQFVALESPPLSLDDHRGIGFMRYFWNCGFFAGVSSTYQYQNRSGSFVAPDGSSAGWLFGGTLGYRLPERHGLITLDLTNALGEDFVLDQSQQFDRTITNDPSVRVAAQINF